MGRDKTLFDELVGSLNEAKDIAKGRAKPNRLEAGNFGLASFRACSSLSPHDLQSHSFNQPVEVIAASAEADDIRAGACFNVSAKTDLSTSRLSTWVARIPPACPVQAQLLASIRNACCSALDPYGIRDNRWLEKCQP